MLAKDAKSASSNAFELEMTSALSVSLDHKKTLDDVCEPYACLTGAERVLGRVLQLVSFGGESAFRLLAGEAAACKVCRAQEERTADGCSAIRWGPMKTPSCLYDLVCVYIRTVQ